MAQVEDVDLVLIKRVIRILVVLVVLLALIAGYFWTVNQKRIENEQKDRVVKLSSFAGE
jgi:hypothetical protein